MTVRCCHIYLLLLIVSHSAAQERNTYYSKDINISNKEFNKIRKIHKDKRGFLWLGGQEGLIATDGKNAIGYTTSAVASHRISEIDIWDVFEDVARDELYVLSSSGTVDIISTSTGCIKRSIRIGNFSQDNWYMSLVKIKNQLWLTSYKGIYIYNLDSGETERLPIGNVTPEQNLLSGKIIVTGYDSAWFHVSGLGLYLYNASNKKVLLKIDNKILTNQMGAFFVVNDIYVMPGNKILLATNQGLREILFERNGRATVNLTPTKLTVLDKQPVSTIQKTRKSIILSTDKLYEYFPDSGRCEPVIDNDNQEQNSAAANITATCFDQDENLYWYCSDAKLKCLQMGSYFAKAFTSKNTGLSFADVYFVHPKGKEIYISCSNGLYKKSSANKFEPVDKTKEYYYQFSLNEKTDILSTGDGIKVLERGQLHSILSFFPEFRDHASTLINSAVNYAPGEWLLGTEDFKGALIWKVNEHSLLSISNSFLSNKLSSNVVNSVYSTENNHFVLSDKSIAVFDRAFKFQKKLAFKKKDHADSAATYFSICRLKSSYYISVYGTGLLQVDSNFNLISYITTDNGLCDNGTYNVFAVSDSALYVTTNHGISIINPLTGKIKNIYKEDGLHSNAFEEAASQFTGGLIYAGGRNGFTIIDPSKVRINLKKPEVYINEIVVKTTEEKLDTQNLKIDRFTVPDNALQTAIYLSGISWLCPERTTFSWRIAEKSEKWTDLGSDHIIPLIGLQPGTYHLQVKAANEDGVWSEPKELVLDFLPKWYQTWWFFALIALAIACILYALYRYRISQIKKQHEIRKNIATDLHDDLGSTLNSVKVFTNLAISGIKQEESLQQVKDNLTEATMSLRDMIWVLDDSLDTVDELVTRLKQFALPVTAASNMEFKISAGSDVNSRTLTKEEKRNLFLICKEAINNSIKYSDASQITVDIKPAGKKIQITITDNGKGFDETTVKKGYGLKNMQYRAGQIKYKVNLESRSGQGTSITILTA